MNDIVFMLEGELDEKGPDIVSWQYIVGKIRTWFRRTTTQTNPSPAQALSVKQFSSNKGKNNLYLASRSNGEDEQCQQKQLGALSNKNKY